MKIVVERNNLLDVLNKAGKAVSGKSNLPIMHGIFMDAKQGTLIMLGSDMDLTILTRTSCEVIEEGKLLVDAKIFSEIVRKLPNGDVTIEITEEDLVQITCKKSMFSISKLNAEDYPEVPKLKDVKPIKLSQGLIKDMVKTVAFSVAQDSSRPILEGILFEIKNGKLNLVSLDGYRVSIRSEIVDVDTDIEVVVKGKILSDIAKLLDSDNKVMQIGVTDNHIQFMFNNTIVLARLLEGKFVAYNSLLPPDNKLSMEVNRVQFLGALSRAALMAKDGNSNLIKLELISTGMIETLIISSKSNLGQGREELGIEIHGLENEFKIAFNSRYLIEVLENIEEDCIVCEFNSQINPCVIRGKEQSDYKYVILPVRLPN